MNKLTLFTTLFMIAFFTACTTQIEMELPQSETTDVTTDNDNDGQVSLRSTQAECDDIQSNLPVNPSGSQIAELLECRLNQGVNEDVVMNNCTFSEQILDSTCVDPGDLISNYQRVVDAQHLETINEADTCIACLSPDPTWGCRSAIYTVTYLNDDDCPGAPDVLLFRIVADIYCCD